jgi:microcystin-dependent protein
MVTLVKTGMIDGGATAAELSALRQLFVGTVHEFPFIPSDPWWVPCHGQILNVADYPLLASRLGTTYGGDGTTTFGLPDRRGRVAAGVDNMGGISANRLTNQSGGLNGDVLGATGGAETHTLTTAQLAAHDHTVTVTGTAASAGDHTHLFRQAGGDGGSTTARDGGSGGYTGEMSTAGAHTHSVTASGTTSSVGSGAAHNNVQPTIAQYFCILAY